MAPDHDIIVAPATAAGGALAVIRISGEGAPALCDRIFRGRRPLASARGYTVHYGRIAEFATDTARRLPEAVAETGDPKRGIPPRGSGGGDPMNGSGERLIDEVLATVFRAPHSYTGEDSVEFSCHGSQYVVAEVLRLLVAAGARMAEPGEFTIRAYLNGRMDLSQAEAVGDMIASSSRAAHALATSQMRGGYSAALGALRERLLELTSLLELELDFSEEEVEFADRTQLRATMERIDARIASMCDSFALGNALKQGVAVAIAGAPNVGKSTLLNRLLNEERALVSEIAGTTRDVIEERTNIDGVEFRFLDTAGIRATEDRLERMGIERTFSSISRAQLIIRMVDATRLAAASGASESDADSAATIAGIVPEFPVQEGQRVLTVVNKTDLLPAESAECLRMLPADTIRLSAKSGTGISALRAALRAAVDTEALYHGDAVVSSSRHLEALQAARESLRGALEGLDNGLPTDLLSEDIRQVIHHLGSITGQGVITPDEVLQTIFSRFCIGK